MRVQRLGLLGAMVLLCAWACGGGSGGADGAEQDPGAEPDPGEHTEVVPLALLSAPAGLCDGDAAPKECSNPAGCETSDDYGYGDPGISASGGSGSYEEGGASGGGVGGAGATSVGGAGATSVGGEGGEGGELAGGAPGLGKLKFSTQQANSACEGLDRENPATLYLSADDSSSMASPVIARHLIRSGQRVAAGLVRPYEFLNYYDFSFEPAEKGKVRVVPQLSSCPVDGALSFQVALQSETREAEQRAPLNLTLVLDTSGSMAGTPLELEQAAVRAIAGQLKAGDVVSVVTWNTDQRELLTAHDVEGTPDAALLGVAEALQAGGGTDLDGGLRRGYELAQEQFSTERINRVVVVSDGIANVGETNAEMIASHANDEEGGSGIYLAGVGVGDGVNDTLLNVVTDAGRGAYIYLDSEDEAEKMLGDRFLSVIDVAARAVRLELTLPWYFQVQKFYGEAISTDASKVYPQHLGPNDAMLFFQILQACDSSLINGADTIKLRATWETPFTREARAFASELSLNDLAGSDATLAKAAAIAGYAEALVAADLAPDAGRRSAVLRRAIDNVLAVPQHASDPDLVEVLGLLEAYRGE